MQDLEIPLDKKTKKYRFFEMLPAILSYGSFVLLIVLSLFNPSLASIFILLIVITLLVKAVGIAVHVVAGSRRLDQAQKVDWRSRLNDLENVKISCEAVKNCDKKVFGCLQHIENVELIAKSPDSYPKPSQIYNAVIVAAYNEGYDVLSPTIQSIIDTTYDKRKMVIAIAYEERGGHEIKNTVQKLQKKYGDKFFAFHIIEHPKDLPNEVVGKGGNITFAGYFLKDYFKQMKISYDDVIVTTLDSDNKPHKTYFDYVTYEYIVHEDRKNLSYQPVSMFTNNIWDVPAPMRVIATSNSFWNIISSMRPHTLRNFASHSQPMSALVEMDFWSTRTIVEDGHQYWRSYFHFNGNYDVTPIYVPIYQDAVLSNTYKKTLKAQFVQLRRWAYGASDVAYVADHIVSFKSKVPFFDGIAKLAKLIDGHVTLACVSLIVAVGAWVPLLLNHEAARSISAHQLPNVVSFLQQIAMIGLVITILMSLKMLPPRPKRYKKSKNIFMVAQWILMPVTSIFYSSAAALYSQGRLFMGRYLDKFDVTDKVTVNSIDRDKKALKGLKK